MLFINMQGFFYVFFYLRLKLIIFFACPNTYAGTTFVILKPKGFLYLSVFNKKKHVEIDMLFLYKSLYVNIK